MRTVVGAACLLVALAPGTGAAPLDTVTLPAPGMYVGIGNHHLHVRCAGAGAPTVVFESGLGGTSLDWSKVQPEVAAFTQACSYDRAGYGWSEAGPRPRTMQRIAEELHALLVYASIAPPYVLVGHSLGGLVVRLYAHRHPRRVAGLVLVDATHERQFERFARADVHLRIAPVGRNFVIANHWQIPDGLPVAVRAQAQSLALTRDAIGALYSELGHLRQGVGALAGVLPPPAVPTVIMTRGRIEPASRGAARRRAELWNALQRELAASAPQAELVEVSGAGHYIQLERPQRVVDTIRVLVGRLRDGAACGSAACAERR